MNSAHSFPDTLDGASVLEYTDKGYFGKYEYDYDPSDGCSPTAASIRYLAVCRYGSEETYYLFECDENLQVINDWALDSADSCKQLHPKARSVTWHKK